MTSFFWCMYKAPWRFRSFGQGAWKLFNAFFWLWRASFFYIPKVICAVATAWRISPKEFSWLCKSKDAPTEEFGSETRKRSLRPSDLRWSHNRPAPINASSTSARAAGSRSMSAMVSWINWRVMANHYLRVIDEGHSTRPSRMEPSGQMPSRMFAISSAKHRLRQNSKQ